MLDLGQQQLLCHRGADFGVRLGPGGSPYKYRFTSLDPGIETVVLAGTGLGKLALRTQGIVQRSSLLRKSLKRLVNR